MAVCTPAGVNPCPSFITIHGVLEQLRNEHQYSLAVLFTQFLCSLQTIHKRHFHIHEDQIEYRFFGGQKSNAIRKPLDGIHAFVFLSIVYAELVYV